MHPLLTGEAKLIDGRLVAETIRKEVAEGVAKVKNQTGKVRSPWQKTTGRCACEQARAARRRSSLQAASPCLCVVPAHPRGCQVAGADEDRCHAAPCRCLASPSCSSAPARCANRSYARSAACLWRTELRRLFAARLYFLLPGVAWRLRRQPSRLAARTARSRPRGRLRARRAPRGSPLQRLAPPPPAGL